MPKASPWTEDRLAMLRDEWATGASKAEIGRRMGISKNAVVGKAHRMRLPAREAPANIVSPKSRGVVSRPAARAHRELPKLSETRAASPSRPRAASISGALSSVVERQASSWPERDLPGAVVEAPPRRVFFHKQCQYITSSADRAHRFCEAPVVENAKGRPSAYCATHFELCLIPAKKAEAERKAQRLIDGKDKTLHVTEKKVDWRHFYWPTGVWS
jgi:GcrA cell cycle regulator